MTAHFHPDGTAQLEYCARCERTALERLQQFQCLAGVMIDPRLHTACQVKVKIELREKISAMWKSFAAPSLSECVKSATGIDL